MKKKLYYILTIFLLVYCYAFQGSRSLWERDEGRYTQVALEMADFGDWLRPQLNDETEHFTKPPMTYWLIATSVKLFGKNEFALRFPNASAYLLTILSMFLLAKAFLKKNYWSAPLVFATFMFPCLVSSFG